MTNRQAELFQKVLEQMETNLQVNLNSYVEDHAFDVAEHCFEGLKHVGNILDNYDDAIDRDDMSWVIGELFNDDVEGIEFINAINDEFEICTDEELEDLIDELKNM